MEFSLPIFNKLTHNLIEYLSFTIPDDLICPAAVVDGSNRRQRLTDQDRIVGGQDVKQNSWPWIARLRIGSFLCGGTILDDNTVVTAAHCCWGFDENAEFVKAIIGDHSTTDDNDGQEVFKATSVNIHPEYDRNTLANDICSKKKRRENSYKTHTEHILHGISL